MKLTDSQRCIMLNQLEILKKLKPSADEKKRYERAQDILLYGYEFFYDKACVVGELFSPISEEISKKVYAIFEMFRVLHYSHEKLPQAEKTQVEVSAIKFSGFDGNNEGDYMGFARFLVEKMDLYGEQKGAKFNSHCPMLRVYDRMLETYKSVASEELQSSNTFSLKGLQKVAASRRAQPSLA